MMTAGLVVPVSAPVIAVPGVNVNVAVVAEAFNPDVRATEGPVTAPVIKGNDPEAPVSTGTMGVADTSAVVADAMLVTAACGAAGVVNLVRVKTAAAVVG